jgi:hypothetical protein
MVQLSVSLLRIFLLYGRELHLDYLRFQFQNRIFSYLNLHFGLNFSR